jgi:hypothetical protein
MPTLKTAVESASLQKIGQAKAVRVTSLQKEEGGFFHLAITWHHL